MNVKGHLIIGILLSIALFPLFGWNSIFALLSSVLLDIDHYLLAVLKTRKLGIKNAVAFHKGGCGKHNLCIFHTVEFFAVIGILSFFSDAALMFFTGMLIHLAIDYLDWFLWFSYYSERIPSILMAPFIAKRGEQVEEKLDNLGRRCIVCGFDKAWDSHLINGHKEVMLCPNHHFLVHKGIIRDEELLKLLEEQECSEKEEEISLASEDNNNNNNMIEEIVKADELRAAEKQIE